MDRSSLLNAPYSAARSDQSRRGRRKNDPLSSGSYARHRDHLGVGVLLGYLLEPERFDKRDAAEFTEQPTRADTKDRRQRQAA